MENIGTAYPVIAAIITVVGTIIAGPRLAAYTARKKAQTDAIERKRLLDEATATAKIDASEVDRAQISADWQWIVSNLRTEVTALTADQRVLREELNHLSTDLDTLRRANTALHVENDSLRDQLANVTTRHDVLKARVDNLDAANIVLRRELNRHGIPIPALARLDVQ
jgi:regulator of replication initiation timing